MLLLVSSKESGNAPTRLRQVEREHSCEIACLQQGQQKNALNRLQQGEW